MPHQPIALPASTPEEAERIARQIEQDKKKATKLTTEDRFFAKLAKRESGCWEWIGSRDVAGYGRFNEGSKYVRAHRWSYEHFVGPIPESLVLDHLCVNPCCVNPEHLEPVTDRENLRRSRNPVGRNMEKRYCKRGHPLFGDNLHVRSDGFRGCRACRRLSQKHYSDRHDRNKAELQAELDRVIAERDALAAELAACRAELDRAYKAG